MANEIYISFLNPVKFVDNTPYSNTQYNTRQFDDYLYADQLAQKWWIQQDRYKQKFQYDDSIKLQVFSNFDPINFYLVDQDGSEWNTVVLQNIVADRYHPGFYIYEGTMSISNTLPEGCYTPMLRMGDPANPKYMKGEPIQVAASWPDTLWFDYFNSTYHGDIIFETGYKPGIRIDGCLGKIKPGGKRFVYEDQRMNPTVLKADPFREFDLGLGFSYGIPDWLIDKVNWIFSCDNVSIDGKPFAYVSDSGTFDIKDEEFYPLRGINITVREGLNRASRPSAGPGNPNVALVTSYNIERRLFGDVDGDGSNNTTQILSIE